MEQADIVNEYLAFLKGSIKTSRSNGTTTISLPFPREEGDTISIDVEKGENGEMVVSDRGFTGEFLYMNGFKLGELAEKPKRLFAQVLRAYNLSLDKDESLRMCAAPEKVPAAIYRFSLAINELIGIKHYREIVRVPVFKRKVRAFLDTYLVRYTEDELLEFELKGMQYQMTFDYKILRNSLFTKLITSQPIIPLWAMHMYHAKKYMEQYGVEGQFLAIFDDSKEIRQIDVEKDMMDFCTYVIPFSDKIGLRRAIVG